MAAALASPHDGKDGEDDEPDGDGVAGDGGGAELTDDPDQKDPARGGDEGLEDAAQGEPEEPEDDRYSEPEIGRPHPDPAAAPKENPELHQNTGAPADRGRHRGPGDPHLGEEPETEDEARIEHDIDGVGDPQDPHGDGRIAGAAKDRVEKKKKRDGG